MKAYERTCLLLDGGVFNYPVTLKIIPMDATFDGDFHDIFNYTC